MQVSKWGNSLAVRLPRKVVEELGLKAGDELDVIATTGQRLELAKSDRRAKALANLARMRIRLPKGYRFNRDEANER